ncbi:GNAT family N-acetyltransferase [Rhodoferax koreense]|uniref:GNAT family N-acetyltransferase n=1 Tax=Rhodoferax koreensis TaxID=1842727 RepID=A0A1P8JU22_9BURK|nr:bifunctional acetate--CoA ligase family protein/GNAT family N-acetyltransferase [Rhodoferax koreense]APW37254.1 GNAT family N-acetyltransferase [Rhodoferax koreense]
MSVRHLQHLFQPRTVAVIGASDRPHSLGEIVMRNLRTAGFTGTVWPVNPGHGRVAGVQAWPDVQSLPETPDLAVVCTPAATVPELIAQLGRRGNRAAVVLSGGMQKLTANGQSLQSLMLQAARPHLLRILGPNCVGLLVPHLGLNASFAHLSPKAGKLAFLSQSGALTTAMLDWADTHGIGFSHFVSMGDCADVDFGDMLDYLASDPRTEAILMYMESVQQPRKFLSAARAAARNKPVLVVKAGRAPAGAKAAASHTGALAGGDDVFDAAIRRAGMLRVDTLQELLDAARTLSRARPPRGDRLAMLTNGGGAGVLAADALALGGGSLATLSGPTLAALDAVLPAAWSHGNPVDIVGDAPCDRYTDALSVLMRAPEVDGVLFMQAPTAIVPSADIAAACLPLLTQGSRTVMASWLGGRAVAQAVRFCEEAGVPTYDTPEEAVSAWLQVVGHMHNREALLQTPSSRPDDWQPDVAAARRIIEAALAEGRSLLGEGAAKQLLAAYGIPVAASVLAATPAQAVLAAEGIGFPVVLKIVSPQISHKSDVGGVALNLRDATEVEATALAMLERVRSLRPEATLSGFNVQQMVHRPGAHELIVGVASDPVFGPVVLFGQGGTAVEVLRDRAVALPPLNAALAEDLVARTRVARLLAGYRDQPAADRAALSRVLVRISQLVCDCAEIAELDINPLLADGAGVIALDARVLLGPLRGDGRGRLAIRPYPSELARPCSLPDGTRVLLRPIRPDDEAALAHFYETAPTEDMRLRFFARRGCVPRSELARYSQIDYDREMTFVAFDAADTQQSRLLGYACGLSDPDNVNVEFAVQVASWVKRHGLATALMRTLRDYAADRGAARLVAECLPDNLAMAGLARSLGFNVQRANGVNQLRLELAASSPATPSSPAAPAQLQLPAA